jgi:hypothetical protein
VNWLTLTVGEVAAVSAIAGALALWLYLRQPRSLRLRVSTLRFWATAPSTTSDKRKLRLREPWPFLAQLLFLIALIAAIGNPQLGSIFHQSRSVAMVIDPSAWSQMQAPGKPSWLEETREQAIGVLEGLPAGDRVLLLRADTDGAPIQPFTTDRAVLRRAIANLQSSSAVPDVPRALAQGLASLGDSSRGLLVYVGPGIMSDKQVQELNEFRNNLETGPAAAQTQFFVRLVEASAPLADRGITGLALKRGEDSPDRWSLFTQLRNYEAVPADVVLNLSVNGQVFRRERVALPANATNSVTDYFSSPSGGVLQAEITPNDGLAADNRAAIELPSSQPISVAVMTGRDGFIDKLRDVLSSNPYVRADFVVPGSNPKADVIIYDGDVEPGAPPGNSISFPPAPKGSTLHRVRLANWNNAHPVTRWIQTRDVSVRVPGPLEPQRGDTVLASSDGDSPEPLILARESNGYRSVVMGFDPLDSNFTVEPAFPLLIAASLEWMTRPVGDKAESLSAGAVDLPVSLTSITAPSGHDVPFARNGDGVHFFAAESGQYKLAGPGGSGNLMVNVPSLPTGRWTPVAQEAAAVEAEPVAEPTRDLWRWLAGFGLFALWLEWQLFYMVRVGREERAGRRPPAGRFGEAGSVTEQRTEESRKTVLKAS